MRTLVAAVLLTIHASDAASVSGDLIVALNYRKDLPGPASAKVRDRQT
ncbi:MAG TPA: hypothetical protein VL084_14575 [Thermoanaerobaculia bacterium]|nr:hypothetical protein [Thermoanaerobaculia bacterium]